MYKADFHIKVHKYVQNHYISSTCLQFIIQRIFSGFFFNTRVYEVQGNFGINDFLTLSMSILYSYISLQKQRK